MIKNFKLLWYYLKDEKLKLFIYLFLALIGTVPSLSSAYFIGMALEGLIDKNFGNFIFYLSIWSSMYIIFYCILQVPRERLFSYLNIKFNKNVIKDLYKKVTDLPCIAYEEIGVGEFINRMVTNPERVLDLLSKLITMI